MKAIEKALTDRIIQRLGGGGYYWPYAPAITREIQAIQSYHDLIKGYEILRGLYSPPTNADVAKILGLKLNPGNFSNDTKSTSLIQLEEQGVPVLVKPTLLRNEVVDADLSQRNYVIDGVNGFDFVQTNDEMDDTVTLQVNGVPVTVNPVLMRPTGMETAKFGNKIRINLDDVTYVQNPVNNPPFNNWSVNQPSVPHNHGMKGNEDLGMRDIIVDGVNYDLLQTEANGVPVTVNPVLMRPTGVESARFGNKMRINLDEITYLQTSNPVNNPPFNNWSVNQPSPPHNHGMKGTEDLGMRDIIVDGVNYDLLQMNEMGVPVYVKPTLLKNTEAETDLTQRNYVIDGVNGFAFAQTKSDGVPVTVQPKLMKDEVAEHDFKENMVVGGDKVSFEADEAVTLQVNGVPVIVDPVVMSNQMENAALDHKVIIGPDDVKFTSVKDGDDDLGQKMVVGGTVINIAQKH